MLTIVTGLGRCGTSILTKYLGECGYGLGQNVNWHKEARAGLELSTAYSITRQGNLLIWISNTEGHIGSVHIEKLL